MNIRDHHLKEIKDNVEALVSCIGGERLTLQDGYSLDWFLSLLCRLTESNIGSEASFFKDLVDLIIKIENLSKFDRNKRPKDWSN